MDCCARGLKAAARMLEEGKLSGAVEERYAGWDKKDAASMMSDKWSLEQITDYVETNGVNPKPVSGRQEILENLVNRYV